MMIDPVLALFAYGTLKRGQCRERFWPAQPLAIHKAWTLGELYDTGPYPALFPGSDAVAGELWSFRSEDIAEVLHVLDEVEEYRPGYTATNLYNREIVQCTDQDGTLHRAYVYFYGRPNEKSSFTRVLATYFWAGRAFAVWPEGGDW